MALRERSRRRLVLAACAFALPVVVALYALRWPAAEASRIARAIDTVGEWEHPQFVIRSHGAEVDANVVTLEGGVEWEARGQIVRADAVEIHVQSSGRYQFEFEGFEANLGGTAATVQSVSMEYDSSSIRARLSRYARQAASLFQ